MKLNDADLELLVYLDCKSRFTRNNFIDGSIHKSWDKNRWERLSREGWIEVGDIETELQLNIVYTKPHLNAVNLYPVYTESY